MGKRLVSEKNELALLSDGGNSAQELLHESSWLSLCSNTLPVCLKSFHQASSPLWEGEMDFLKSCFVRATRETGGGSGGGRSEFVSGFGMRLKERRKLREEMVKKEKAKMVLLVN